MAISRADIPLTNFPFRRKLPRMTAASESFAAWACDPRRTLEERFGAELLIEQTLGLWRNKHGIKVETNYEAERLRLKERGLDPAHQPAYSRADAEHAEEVLPELKKFSDGGFDDRPLRDFSILCFCPPLECLELHHSEIRDWSPLLCQSSLATLNVWGDRVARDLRVIGKLTRLQSLHLHVNLPWPDLRGLENLTELRDFHFNGNVLSFRDVPQLPQVRHFDIGHLGSFDIPLRTVNDLPAMPELRRLKLDNTAELDGIERYTKLLNLEVYGYFTDLTPLAALKELTHLTISGGYYETLAPLSRLPNLRRLTVRLEVPPDFTPMADAPRLHEIVMEISHIVPPELASLNALFPPWSDDFALPQPRPLAPLKLLHRDLKKGDPKTEETSTAASRDWGDDDEMGKSEARWFVREANRRLRRLLGDGCCKFDEHGLRTGYEMITIGRPEDIDRVPEIARCLRELFAAARHPWEVMLIVDSLERYERDMDEIYKDDDEEFDAEKEREEWEYRQECQRERRKFLERKYHVRLQQELGNPVVPLPPDPADQPGDEEDADTLQTTAEETPSEYELGTRLHLYSTLTEKAAYFNHESDRSLAEMLFGLKAGTG
jgi:hypothetical protein